jgi:hypothetical protein
VRAGENERPLTQRRFAFFVLGGVTKNVGLDPRPSSFVNALDDFYGKWVESAPEKAHSVLPLRLTAERQFRRNALSMMLATLSARELAKRMRCSRFGFAILWLDLVFWMRVRGFDFAAASATFSGVGI